MEIEDLEQAKIIINLLEQQYNNLNKSYVQAVALNISLQSKLIALKEKLDETNKSE